MNEQVTQSRFPNSIISIKYLSEEKKVTEHTFSDLIKDITNDIINLNEINQIIITPSKTIPEKDNVENLICGIPPIWKIHKDKESFEYYYTRSEMMRVLYANEYEADGNLAPIYIEINNERIVATWESTHENDIFHYRSATVEECGLLDLLWQKYGRKEKEEYKLIPPHIRIIIDDDNLTIKQCKNISQHISNLGFDPQIVLIP